MTTSEHRKNVRIRLEQSHRDLRERLTASNNSMDPDVKRVWVKALRSGKYKQGQGTMCRLDSKGAYSFCCIGVLADENIDTDWILLDHSSSHRLGPDGAAGSLAIDNLEMLGLSIFAQNALAKANDAGLRFSSIADAIEECL